jgi:hypothetical protein
LLSIFLAARALFGSLFFKGHFGGARAKGAFLSRETTSLTTERFSLFAFIGMGTFSHVLV